MDKVIRKIPQDIIKSLLKRVPTASFNLITRAAIVHLLTLSDKQLFEIINAQALSEALEKGQPK